jgi:hypothetical protein
MLPTDDAIFFILRNKNQTIFYSINILINRQYDPNLNNIDNSIEIAIDFDSSCAATIVSSSRAAEVVVSLSVLRNYTGKDGKVRLAVGRRPCYVAFVINDNLPRCEYIVYCH